MKSRLVIASLFAGLLILGSIRVAQAQWSAIKQSGYAVTTNWHGINVPVGSSVVATAGTTDLSVAKVEFIWREPPDGNGAIAFEEEVDVTPGFTPHVPPNVPQEVIDWANAEPPGTQYLYAQSTHPLNAIGDWGVQALFKDDVNIRGRDLTAIRATSFNAVPEVPLGTLVIMLSMFGALGLFKVKKRYMTTPSTQL